MNVRLYNTRTFVAGHVWMTCGKWSKRLKVGDTISFDARVTGYEKGYKGYRDDGFAAPLEKDYRLDRPTHVKVRSAAMKKN